MGGARGIAAVLLYVFVHTGLAAVEDGTEGTPCAELAEIAEGVHVRPGVVGRVFVERQIANIGFVIGTECVAVIDTGGSLEEGQALSCAIRRLTAVPVCYVINTHVHPDHILGNLAFKGPGVHFIGHQNLPRAMALVGPTYLRRAARFAGQAMDERLIVPPERLVRPGQPLELDLGGRTLRIEAQGRAHTDSDLIVVDERSQTLWLGDLVFVEHIPVLDGSVLGWLQTLETLRARTARQAVPGHGPPSVPWPGAAQDTMRYLSVLRNEVREWIANDGTLQGAQDHAGEAERDRWALFDSYHKRNIAAAYRELEWED